MDVQCISVAAKIAKSSEPMTSLVDQSHTFYLHPFLRHPQRCMVWKQVKLVIESKWNPKWGRMTGYAVTAYIFAAIEEQPCLGSTHCYVQLKCWSQKWCNDVQRLSCKNMQKHGKERPASTASLVPAARISKARRVHFVERQSWDLICDQEEPRKRARLVPEKSQTLAVAWLGSRAHEEDISASCAFWSLQY